MEQRIIIANLRSDSGKRFLDLAQYALTIAGTNTFSSIIGTGGIVIPALSLIISLIIGIVQPHYNPIRQTISQLVHYPHGWLQTTDFLILSCWLILFAVKFYSDFTHRLTTKIAVSSLVLLGIGFFMITIFPTNFPGSEKTIQSLIHEKTAQFICVLFPISCTFIIPEFKASSYWNKFTTYTIVTAVIGFIFVGIGVVITITEAPLLGILERLIMLNAVVWLEVIGFYLVLQRFNNRNSHKATNPVMQTSQQMTR
jgi:hypothetical protein